MRKRQALRIALLVFCAPSVAHIARAAETASATRSARIGVLGAASPRLLAQFGVLVPFFDRLRELGYVEGQNLVVEYRLADGNPERLPYLARELVQLKVDIILATGPAAAHAAADATSSIPVVFTLVGDAVAEGLVTSLARPEKNLTGASISGGIEIVGKRVQLLKQAVPSIARIGLLWNPGNPSHAALAQEAPRTVKTAGIEPHMFEVRRPQDIDALFATLGHERVDGLVVLEDVIFALRAKDLADFLLEHRTPSIFGATEFVEVGGMMSYQTSFATVNMAAATYVARILGGAKPNQLPVQEPTKFELVINLHTAKALGIAIPQSVLLQADRVIQ
jgi:putative ABC transport system substrate-binding protein